MISFSSASIFIFSLTLSKKSVQSLSYSSDSRLTSFVGRFSSLRSAKLGLLCFKRVPAISDNLNQRTNGPVNAHLISWPSKAQNIHNLENIW